jgi:transcriptional regulator with XRE-family HTH domain
MKRRTDIASQFGLAVRSRRDEVGITQERLAALAKINRSYVGDVERGSRNVSLRNVVKLAQALGLTADELVRRAVQGRGNG